MNQLEENVIKSFRLAKSDIIQLQNQVIELSKKQEGLLQMIMKVKDKQRPVVQRTVTKKPMVRVVTKQAKKHFVVSKEGTKFHIPECPFAKNIKPKSRVVYKSKNTALNNGYKACNCVKRV